MRLKPSPHVLSCCAGEGGNLESVAEDQVLDLQLDPGRSVHICQDLSLVDSATALHAKPLSPPKSSRFCHHRQRIVANLEWDEVSDPTTVSFQLGTQQECL